MCPDEMLAGRMLAGRRKTAGSHLPPSLVRQSLTTHNLTISVPMMEQNPCQIVGTLVFADLVRAPFPSPRYRPR